MTTIVGALAPSDVQAFMVAGLTIPDDMTFAFDSDIPSTPNRLYVITGPNSGTGMNVEGGYDGLVMQLLTRGNQGQGPAGKAAAAEDARTLAWAADRLFMEAKVPIAVGSQHVNLITRSGGPPAMFRREPSGRVSFTCNYLFNVARY